jgi:hypothetical protein
MIDRCLDLWVYRLLWFFEMVSDAVGLILPHKVVSTKISEKDSMPASLLVPCETTMMGSQGRCSSTSINEQSLPDPGLTPPKMTVTSSTRINDKVNVSDSRGFIKSYIRVRGSVFFCFFPQPFLILSFSKLSYRDHNPTQYSNTPSQHNQVVVVHVLAS